MNSCCVAASDASHNRCVHVVVNQTMVLQIHRKIEVQKKISTNDGQFYISNSNVQGKFRPIPKFIFNAVVPKVWMVVPFAASNVLLLIEVL